MLQLPLNLTDFLYPYLMQRKLYLLSFFIVSLVWAIEMSIGPYLLKLIIDGVAKSSSNQDLLINSIFWPAIGYGSLSFVINLNFRFYNYISLKFYPELKEEIIKKMFNYLLGHSFNFFQNNFSGSLSKKIQDMANNVELILNITNEMFYPRLMALVVASLMLCFTAAPVFAFILFVWAVFFVLGSYWAAKKSESFSKNLSEANNLMDGFLVDSVSNIFSTKIFARQYEESLNLENYIATAKKNDKKLQMYNLKVYFFQGLGVSALILSLLSCLIYGNLHGWVSAGDFAFVLTLGISFIMAVFNLGQSILSFTKSLGICKQSLSILFEPHEITNTDYAKDICLTKAGIEFKNVCFSHSESKILLNNFNMTIPHGQKVGLVGVSGGGKSTILKLILRLMDIQSGQILLDDQPTLSFTQKSLQNNISCIPQEIDLFHRSIMENIRFAKPSASDEEVIQASKKAICHNFILELDNGYQSLVGERGVKLSGGQKQRIAIARALLKSSPIILMDEATSALDSVTEKYIQESLLSNMDDKTVIVIAHRLATIVNLDRILVIEDGKIVEDGSAQELLKNANGKFSALWAMQSQGIIPDISRVDLP